MIKSLKSVLAVLLLTTLTTTVYADVGATIGYHSDYIFRGQSQTQGEGSVFGSVDWGHDSGIYAGAWTSEVDFDGADRETDMYIGYATDLGSLGVDVSYVDYAYGGNSTLDGSEIWLQGSIGDMSVLYVMGQDDWNDYTEFGYSIMGVELSLGRWDNIGDNMKISKSFELPLWELNGEIAFVDFTADSESELLDEDTIMFSISKSF